ncbi:hypothetical protein ACH5RR_040943 [Cinchona calisaya]|uniref:Uncharacterized protein n=1 Tax=Cinchona calisaya TaxID=153742 RepID=A0ABD2XU37_9GENT
MARSRLGVEGGEGNSKRNGLFLDLFEVGMPTMFANWPATKSFMRILFLFQEKLPISSPVVFLAQRRDDLKIEERMQSSRFKSGLSIEP